MTGPLRSWWDGFILRLQRVPLAMLAADYPLSQDELVNLLVESSRFVAADASPWWPEALRMRSTHSIREIARFFHTEPRRIRRGLARQALRVAGRELMDGLGSTKISPFIEMIGKERDRAVARAAGVIPEAIAGERRRLDIPPYYQRARIRLSRDDEEWIRGPRKGRRERFRPDAETLQVVRRPVRVNEAARDLPPVMVNRGGRSERPLPPLSLDPVASVETESPFRRPPVVSPGDFYSESRRRDFYRSERDTEIDLLLQPTRARDGRQRIVRADPVRPEVEEPAPLGVVRRRVVPTERPRSTPEASVVRRVPSMGLPASSAPTASPTPVLAAPVRSAAPPALSRPPAVAPVVLPQMAPPAVAPQMVAPPAIPSQGMASQGVASRVVERVPTRRTTRGAVAERAIVEDPVEMESLVNDLVEWLVYVPGRPDPLRVQASDIAAAASMAASMIPATLLARASIWRADGAAPAPELL